MTGRTWVLVVLAAVVVVSIVPVSVGGASGGVEGMATSDAGAGVAVADVQPRNNSTQHEDPDKVSQEGDIRGIQAWLAGRMGEQLVASSIQLSQGEYERARSLLGDDYDDQLGKYVDVAGETTSERDDETGALFEETRDTQETLSEDVQEFQETRAEYEAARANGNEQRARELARELIEQAEAIQRNATEQQRNFQELENRTAVETDPARQAIENVSENISAQQLEVRNETFVATELDVSAASSRISFADPLELSGRLVAENGSPVADRRIRIQVGEQSIATTTDGDGRFVVTYRPTTIPIGKQTVAVRYVPRDSSVFLGASAEIDVTVTQVESRIEVASRTPEAAFGDTVSVSGSVSAAGSGAAGVPVVVSIGDERLGTTTTGANGTFSFDGMLPAAVPTGERDLTVRVALENRALASSSASTDLQVRASETDLSIREAAVVSDGLRVRGTLETATGLAVPEQRVVVSLTGTTLGTVRTDDEGAFVGTFDVPGGLRPESGSESLALLAVFDAEGTNLQPARVRDSVVVAAVDAGDGTGSDGGSDRPLADLRSNSLLVGLIAVVAVGLLGGAAWLRRRRRGGSQDADSESDPVAATGESAATGPERSSVGVAQAALDGGARREAVAVAYMGVREELERSLALEGSRTHWEFLEAVRTAGLGADVLAGVEELTGVYERATFAPGPVPVELAEEAVARARAVRDSLTE